MQPQEGAQQSGHFDFYTILSVLGDAALWPQALFGLLLPWRTHLFSHLMSSLLPAAPYSCPHAIITFIRSHSFIPATTSLLVPLLFFISDALITALPLSWDAYVSLIHYHGGAVTLTARQSGRGPQPSNQTPLSIFVWMRCWDKPIGNQASSYSCWDKGERSAEQLKEHSELCVCVYMSIPNPSGRRRKGQRGRGSKGRKQGKGAQRVEGVKEKRGRCEG